MQNSEFYQREFGTDLIKIEKVLQKIPLPILIMY